MKHTKGALIGILSLLLVLMAVPSCSKDGGDDDGPMISTIDPSSGLTGSTVKITGKNLSDAFVTIGGISGGVSDNTANSLTTTIPSGLSAGKYTVEVSNDMGSTEASITVTGKGAAPVITGISPKEAAKGQSVTIKGTGLAGAVVEIATKVSQITNNTAGSITVVVPSNIALGAASVRVTTSLGTVVSDMTIK